MRGNKTVTVVPTADIKKEWYGLTQDLLNVIRRLQSESKTEGCAILTVTVAVNADGNPICWQSPRVTRLEPKGSCSVDHLLELLGA